MWWSFAAAKERNNAKESLTKDMTPKDMTPKDISKAQNLARECVKKNYKDCQLHKDEIHHLGVLIWFRDISKAFILSTLKKLTLVTLLIISCGTAWAADYEKGYAAARAGDFATALAELKPLAEQGGASAQFTLA